MKKEEHCLRFNKREFVLFYRAVKELLRQNLEEPASDQRQRARKLLRVLDENLKLARVFDPSGSAPVNFKLELGQKDLGTAYEATVEAVKSELVSPEEKKVYREMRDRAGRLFKKTELCRRTN